jgi:hypothetical protein
VNRKVLMAFAAAAAAALLVPTAAAAQNAGRAPYEPKLNPADFVHAVTNPYFPLPVGRTLTYRGLKDGTTQVDVVHVTAKTRVLEGIRAVAVSDVATHNGKLLEKTTDWYAQDKRGNVWYLGEATAQYLPGGKVDRSGSWLAGVKDAEPGIVMRAHPRVPGAYRQEYFPGQAEDTAWIVSVGGSAKVPFGVLHHVLTSLEFTRLEPDVIDEKVYAPGIGIAVERAMHGPVETARLVSVTG